MRGFPIFVSDKSEFIMLEARKYNWNRIILFVAFSVSDAVVKILEREQQLFIYLRAYFVIQWIAALILFIITKR